MRWNLNSMLRVRGVIIVVAFVLSVCSITPPVMCFTSTSSSVAYDDNASASTDNNSDSIPPAATQHKWQQIQQHLPDTAIDATKPSFSLCIGDKRCDHQRHHKHYHHHHRQKDASDHHQSNDLAISLESLKPSASAHVAIAEDEKTHSAVSAETLETLANKSSTSAEDVAVSMSPNAAPDARDNDHNGNANETCDDCDDGSVTVEDDINDSDDDYASEEMQNDQAAVYRPNAGGSSGHHYGNMRSHQRAPNPPPSTQQQQQQQQQHHRQSSDFNVEFTPELLIKQGRLRGTVRSMHSQSGLRSVHQFLGIPYAAAPVGNGRFMPPGAPPPWHGSKVFTVLSPVCPQNLPQIGNGSTLSSSAAGGQISAGRYDQLKRLLPFLRNENEDCLFLNLYAPQVDEKVADKARFPVIVFVHGESYEWNSGNPYDGSVLASYGQVVVVTLNYRLGILGFLKPGLGEHTVSNFGLLDQIAALQWVKDNIAAFGGNNRAVTLMGHGTGAACVNLLMLSPVARGLFHRAILMSGSALSDWAFASHTLPTTMQVVRAVNCPLRDDNEETLQCLRKKRYQEIMQQRMSKPEYGTVFGPVVDNLVVPNQPQKIMDQYSEMFSRYDLLFGMTEIESYHNLNAVGLAHGLLESERDSYLRLYMQHRFEIRPDIALALTLQEYGELYNNPERPLATEHRDTVLEILSDARVAAPLLQTGLYHSKVNPRSYMYVFGHNSRAGEYANLPQSIVGEELPYVFGAPLAATTPFPSKYSPEERLLSESIMVAWTNFAKTGNPRAPSRDRFLNLEPKDWERYDIDWPEFNAASMNYLNIGIPPVVNQKYRHRYMMYWNQALPDELNRTLSMLGPSAHHPHLYAPTSTVQTAPTVNGPSFHRNAPFGGTSIHPAAADAIVDGGGAHINYYPDRDATDDPFRALKVLLNRQNLNDHSDMYNTQSTASVVTATIIDNGTPEDFQHLQHLQSDGRRAAAAAEEQQHTARIVRADAMLGVMITVIISFVLLNVVVIGAWLMRRWFVAKSLRNKLDMLSLDGGTTEADTVAAVDAKLSMIGGLDGAGGDDDGGFIMDSTMRRQQRSFDKSNDYETVTMNGAKPSPMKGYLLGSDLSNSTVDAHTKVSDWMCQEIRNGDEQLKKKTSESPQSFSLKGRGFFRRHTKSSESRQTPETIAEHEKNRYPLCGQHSHDTIICQDVDVDAALIDGSIDLRDGNSQQNRSSIPSLKGSADILHISANHRHSRSDPVPMYYRRAPAPDEDISLFCDIDPAMSSTRRDASVEKQPVRPEDALATIRMRNYPKVLPRVPDDSTEYVSSALIKRRSLPPQYFSANASALRVPPPQPPPRTTSTLGRKQSARDSHLITTSPLMVAAEPPGRADSAEPEIACNVLHIGPLLPKSTESIYSTVSRTPRSPLRNPTTMATPLTTQFTFENCVTIESSGTGTTASAPEPNVHRHSPIGKVTPPKVAARPSLLRQLCTMQPTSDGTDTIDGGPCRRSVHSIQEEEQQPEPESMPTPVPVTGKVISSRIPQMKQRASLVRSTSSGSAGEASTSSSSAAETVKQVVLTPRPMVVTHDVSDGMADNL